ncbi:MAG: DUF917 domain-containing protein, partial [Asgard group archaeon]|nr:DUF917 domain-containing protein [Asgard group archaeon]
GDELILKKAITDQRAERLARELAVLSGGSVGVARCPARWSDYRRAVIPNTMSLAQNLGAAIRHSREKNQNPIETILEVLDGKLLFSGRVIDCTITDHGGFVLGELYLKDIDDNQLKIWFKNEYLISWFNGKPFITAPDLLCVVDSETGEGLSPWADNFSHLRAVSVIGKKNHPHWYTPKGLALFGPRHFGFDFDYNDFLIAK